MAIVKRKVTRPRRQEESRSNTEGEKKEETQSEVNSDENIDISSISDAEEEIASQTRKQEIAKGKRPMQPKEGKKRKWDIDDTKFGRVTTKGIVINEDKRSQTKASVRPKAKGIRLGRVYAVKSRYELRKGPKGPGVNASSECEQTNVYHESKGKEKVTQDLEDLETDPEEACGRTKIKKTSDDDTDDNGGGGGEAHGNVPSLGVELVAAN